MTSHEARAAWRLFTFNWVPLGLMAAALGLGLALTGFSIKPQSALLSLSAISAYTAVAYWKARRDRDPAVVFVLGSTGQILLTTFLMTPLTYIAAAADLPMQDATFAALDRALGLDWPAYFQFVYDRPQLIAPLVLGYGMIGWPIFGVPVVLGLARKFERLQQFTFAFGLALVVTAVLSAILPAIGTYDELGIKPDPNVFVPGAYLDQLRDLPLVRDGTLRDLDILKLAGIITFPSFHAAAAVLYLWAFWGVRWMRPVALIANGAMLLATPLGGGHYFVDVFAGIAVAVLAIAVAKWLGALLTRNAAMRTRTDKMLGAPAGAGSFGPVAVPAE